MASLTADIIEQVTQKLEELNYSNSTGKIDIRAEPELSNKYVDIKVDIHIEVIKNNKLIDADFKSSLYIDINSLFIQKTIPLPIKKYSSISDFLVSDLKLDVLLNDSENVSDVMESLLNEYIQNHLERECIMVPNREKVQCLAIAKAKLKVLASRSDDDELDIADNMLWKQSLIPPSSIVIDTRLENLDRANEFLDRFNKLVSDELV